MKFKGNIIITDPCYIINKKEVGVRPKMSDYKGLERITGSTPFKEYTSEEMDIYNQYDKDCDEWKAKQTDDWLKCEYGENMEVLGIKTYLTRDTIYGDWSCTTYNSDSKEELGQFCADAGLVSVFLLDEVLAYNPDFDYHINRPWTTTLIKDFDGEIEIDVVPCQYRDEDTDELVDYEEVRVMGKGNINFFTSQTGL